MRGVLKLKVGPTVTDLYSEKGLARWWFVFRFRGKWLHDQAFLCHSLYGTLLVSLFTGKQAVGEAVHVVIKCCNLSAYYGVLVLGLFGKREPKVGVLPYILVEIWRI